MTAASNEVALLPCPFCGGEATVQHLMSRRWSAGCVDDRMCFAPDLIATSRTKAIAAWNTRAHSDPRPVAEGLREAFTPSAETKAAYIGEFGFNIMDRDEDGEEVARRVLVPWHTIKEIMAAIAARAATHSPAPMAGEGAIKLLGDLERSATAVHRKGAVSGPQWSRLSGDLIRSRAFLAAHPSTQEG